MKDRITLADIRASGLCIAGIEKWFARNKLDFAKFEREGMSLEDAEKVDDAMARRALRKRLERMRKGK